jgi:group I intron endonuclease
VRYIHIKDKTWCVYIHTSPSGKKYVGITCKPPEWRWRNGKGYIQNKHFTAAIQKYGWDNFSHDIVADNLSKAEACELEQKLIKQYDTQSREHGYNKSSGGELSGLGVKMTDEQKMFLSERLKGQNNPMYGKHLSDEAKRKLSEAKRGKKMPDECRRKISESNKDVERTPEWKRHLSESLTGKALSEEHKAKVSKGIADKWQDPEYRAMMVEAHSGTNSHKAQKVLCVETGEVFDCIKFACKKYGVHSSSVSNVCRGKLKTTGGYHWQYAN